MSRNVLAAFLIFTALHCAVANLCSSGIPTGDALRISAECEEDIGLQISWEGDNSYNVNLVYIEYSCRRLSTSNEQEREILVRGSYCLSECQAETNAIPKNETTECTVYACYLDDAFDLIGVEPVSATCGGTPDPDPETEATGVTSGSAVLLPTPLPTPLSTPVPKYCTSGIPNGDALRINAECREGGTALQVSWEGDSWIVNLVYIEYSCRRLSASDEQREHGLLVRNSYCLSNLCNKSIMIPEGESTECTIYACYLDDQFDLIGAQSVTATCGATATPDTEPTGVISLQSSPSPVPSILSPREEVVLSGTHVDNQGLASEAVVVRGLPNSDNEQDQEYPVASSTVITSVTGTISMNVAVALVLCLGM